MCLYKCLYKNPHSQYMGLEEDDFLHFYEVIDFKWMQVSHFSHLFRFLFCFVFVFAKRGS